MRILGLDVGEKRIGIAKVDTLTKIAIPIGFIEVDGTEWQRITSYSNLNSTKNFVLGLPRSNEGNETAQSLFVRKFAKTLVEKIPGAIIRFEDETLTSVEAEKRLKARKKPYQKGDIDAESAAIILQEFIDNYQESTNTPTVKKTDKTPEVIEKVEEKVKKSTKKAMLNSKKVAHKSKKLLKFLIVSPIVLVVIIAAILTAILLYKNSLHAVDQNCADTCKNIIFDIKDGESINQIAEKLESEKLINNALTFKIHYKINHKNETLKTGSYTLNQGLSAAEITKILIAGSKSSNVFNFTILPGENTMDIKKKLEKIGYTRAEIDEAFAKDYDYNVLKTRTNNSLEGFLYPETFEFYKNETVENILRKFIEKFSAVAAENNLEASYSARGLTLYQGIIVASIVQKEAYTKDQPTVAQVFLTRIQRGGSLGSDVTATYAADLVDPERKSYTSNAAVLNIDSCYNTRKYAGMPCGAISSPSLSALLAVANPTDTNYYYFLTGDDGKMYYSYTESEHNQNAKLHCKVLCNASL